MTTIEHSNSEQSPPSTSRTVNPISIAGKAFHKELNDVFNLFDLVAKSVSGMDKVIRHLQFTDADPEKTVEQSDDKSEFGPYGERLRNHSQLFLQMIICRLVDNFSNYLADVIREVIYSKPELLKSKEQLRVDYVLQFDSMPDLLVDLVDRKVTDLSYGGFAEMEKWCDDKLGLPLAKDDEQRDALIELIETRNIFIHNRGKVGAKYLRNVTNTSLVKGQDRIIYLDYFVDAITILGACALTLDEKLAAKYDISATSEM